MQAMPAPRSERSDSRTAVIRSEVREPAARCLAQNERLHNILVGVGGAGMVTACHERSLMAASNSGRIAERNPCSRLLPASGENAALIATFTSVPMARFNQSFFPKRSHQGSQRRFHAGGIIGHVEERLLPSPSGTAPARHLEGSSRRGSPEHAALGWLYRRRQPRSRVSRSSRRPRALGTFTSRPGPSPGRLLDPG